MFLVCPLFILTNVTELGEDPNYFLILHEWFMIVDVHKCFYMIGSVFI